MKKLLIICLVLVQVLLVTGCKVDNSKYPAGRDTHEQFGDGRFAVITINVDDYPYSLFDEENKKTIADDILNYKEVKPYVYAASLVGMNPEPVYGDDSLFGGAKVVMDSVDETETIYYTKLNYETGYAQQSTDVTKFSEEDQKIFNEL